MPNNKKIAVVGAGVGGLATAARLAKHGYEVNVFEKLPCCGGRNNIIEDKGFKFDTGPSFVLMPDFFEELFSYCGEDISEYLKLQVLDPSYKIFYADNSVFTVSKDSTKTKDDLERFERGSAKAFDAFLEETGKIYKVVQPLLYKCVTKRSLADPFYWPLAGKIKVFESYWNLARKFFKSEKLCFAFTFEAMFMGVSPFQAPAFYSVITYADHAQKIFHPMGGMYEIPRAVERMAKKFGAKIHYESPVDEIFHDSGKLRLKGRTIQADADTVVVNADYAYTQEKLLKRKLKKYQYSCSVYLLYLGMNRKIGGLAHHNLFIAKNPQENLKDIFSRKVIPRDPSFYIHMPTITDPSLAPAGKEIVYILVPVPNLENAKFNINDHEELIRKTVFDRVKQSLGVDLSDGIEVEHRFYPQDFISKYNIANGATFGLSHNLMQSAFFRPANKDSRIPGLYYVGASTQPGGGLPPVIASSRIVADMVIKGQD